MTTTEDARWHRRQLEAFHVDLLEVVGKHYPALGAQSIVHGLIESTGRVLAAIAAGDPASRAAIDAKLSWLHLFVTTTDQATQ